MIEIKVISKRFEQPDEIREMAKGRFELLRLGGLTVWRGKAIGAELCEVEHVGLVLSGPATASMRDGAVTVMAAGDAFYMPPGHNSWVVGDVPYVLLHIHGADEYAFRDGA